MKFLMMESIWIQVKLGTMESLHELKIKKELHELEFRMTIKRMLQTSLYGNFLQKTKKGKWNGILHGEFDSLVGTLNVVQCLANIFENSLISTLDE
jgi:hypothetical protein